MAALSGGRAWYACRLQRAEIYPGYWDVLLRAHIWRHVLLYHSRSAAETAQYLSVSAHPRWSKHRRWCSLRSCQGREWATMVGRCLLGNTWEAACCLYFNDCPTAAHSTARQHVTAWRHSPSLMPLADSGGVILRPLVLQVSRLHQSRWLEATINYPTTLKQWMLVAEDQR